MYARYLQQVYLEAKAKHDFKLQEKHAMVSDLSVAFVSLILLFLTQAQMHGLWLENEKLRKQEAELRLKLMKLKHLNKLDAALDIQVMATFLLLK
jgi:hypothetical protein